MTREQFLEQLRQALSGMKAEELEGVISCYDEMLDDRMEAGMTEEAAVNAGDCAGDRRTRAQRSRCGGLRVRGRR